MLSIIVLEDDALQRHRVGRLLTKQLRSRRPLLMDTFYEQWSGIVPMPIEVNPWFIF